MNVYDLPTQLPRTQPIHINRFLFKTFYSKGDYDSKIQAQPYPDTHMSCLQRSILCILDKKYRFRDDLTRNIIFNLFWLRD